MIRYHQNGLLHRNLSGEPASLTTFLTISVSLRTFVILAIHLSKLLERPKTCLLLAGSTWKAYFGMCNANIETLTCDLPLSRPKHGDKKGQTNKRPQASVTCYGARVASQRCSIR